MNEILISVPMVLVTSTAWAAYTCKPMAIDKDGKVLAGAAYNRFLVKCTKYAQPKCETTALSKEGKPLFGAAKSSYARKGVNGPSGLRGHRFP